MIDSNNTAVDFYCCSWKSNPCEFYCCTWIRNPRDECCPQLNEHLKDWLPWFIVRLIPFFFITGFHLFRAIQGLIELPDDFFNYILKIFIANLVVYFFYYLINKIAEFSRNAYRKKYQWNISLLIFFLFIIFLLILTSVFVPLAISYFSRPAYSWEYSSALSRNINTDCTFLDFFDDHDIWHFLSAIALFSTFLVLLFFDEDLNREPRQSIVVF
jgi:hypothetical protein